MVFFRESLSDSDSLQVTRTLLSIQANVIVAVFWVALIFPLISSSFSPFSKLLGIVPSAPTAIGITLTLVFQFFIQFSDKVQVFVYLFALLTTFSQIKAPRIQP